MRSFVDTSVLLAYLDRDDRSHGLIVRLFGHSIERDEVLLTSNYVALETHALVQRRLGMGAIRTLQSKVLPKIDILWIDRNIHQTGVGMVAAANHRSLSLVDCTSFEIMHREGLHTVLTLDQDFAEQGFDVLPALQV